MHYFLHHYYLHSVHIPCTKHHQVDVYLPYALLFIPTLC